MSSKVQALLGDSLKNTKAIKWAQEQLEQMQLTVATSTVLYTKSVERAKKALAKANERINDLKRLGLTPVSNYDQVVKIYKAELKGQTQESLAQSIYSSKAIERVMKYTTTEAQTKVIAEYCNVKAMNSIHEITSIGKFLESRGLLKETEPTDKEKAKAAKAAKIAAKAAAKAAALAAKGEAVVTE